MVNWIFKRTVLAATTVAVLSLLIFFIIQVPQGDYLDAWLAEASGHDGQIPGMSYSDIEQWRKQFGLDESLHVQYRKWIWSVIRWDLGWSLSTQQPVSELIGERLFLTIVLALVTKVFIWVLSVPIGIYSAVRQHSVADHTFTFIGFIGLAVPDFLLALTLMYFAFVWFDLSVGGLFSFDYIDAPWSFGRIVDLLQHLWIPAFVLGTSGTAALIRVMRANLLDELRKPYVVTARSKGKTEFKTVMKYPVRVALNPLISTVGYVLPALLGGSIIVSVVLSLPTIGPILLRSLLQQDAVLAGTLLLLIAVLTVVGTLISDILLAVADPRIRIEES